MTDVALQGAAAAAGVALPRPVRSPADAIVETVAGRRWRVRALGWAALERFHDLRHSTASFLLHIGIPPLEVARILGHSSVTTTTTIYAHALNEETSSTAAQVMGEALRKRT